MSIEEQRRWEEQVRAGLGGVTPEHKVWRGVMLVLGRLERGEVEGVTAATLPPGGRDFNAGRLAGLLEAKARLELYRERANPKGDG